MIKTECDLLDFIDEVPQECIEEVTQPGYDAEPYLRRWVRMLKMKCNVSFARKYIGSYGIENVNKMQQETLCCYLLWRAAFDKIENNEEEPE